MEAWCEFWNIKIDEDIPQEIYFCRSRRPPESCLDLGLDGFEIGDAVGDDSGSVSGATEI
jgi:hypothetical protein